MKFIHVKTDLFLQGLPARDLDDTELNDEQKALLVEAVSQGIYQVVTPAKPPKPPVKSIQSQGETNGSNTGTDPT